MSGRWVSTAERQPVRPGAYRVRRRMSGGQLREDMLIWTGSEFYSPGYGESRAVAQWWEDAEEGDD